MSAPPWRRKSRGACALEAVDWETVGCSWRRWLTLAKNAGEDEPLGLPRDALGPVHVFVYCLPLVSEGEATLALLQMRDRKAFHLGLFGGELELWGQGALDQLGSSESRRQLLLQHLSAELLQELGLTMGSDAAPCGEWRAQRMARPRTGWQAAMIVLPVRVCASLSFPQVVRRATDARDFFIETRAVIPVRIHEELSVCVRVSPFQPYHDSLLLAAVCSVRPSLGLHYAAIKST